MPPPRPSSSGQDSTITLISRAHLQLSRQVNVRVARAGHDIKPSHGAVFGQLTDEGGRLTDLARNANMSPQAMGELADELEAMGYVARTADPTDGRAKLITLTEAGRRCLDDGEETIAELERQITATLGEPGHNVLRRMLIRLLHRASGPPTS